VIFLSLSLSHTHTHTTVIGPDASLIKQTLSDLLVGKSCKTKGSITRYIVTYSIRTVRRETGTVRAEFKWWIGNGGTCAREGKSGVNVVTGEKGGHSWKRQVHVQNLEKEDRLVV
jgi:hypothetical protein